MPNAVTTVMIVTVKTGGQVNRENIYVFHAASEDGFDLYASLISF